MNVLPLKLLYLAHFQILNHSFLAAKEQHWTTNNNKRENSPDLQKTTDLQPFHSLQLPKQFNSLLVWASNWNWCYVWTKTRQCQGGFSGWPKYLSGSAVTDVGEILQRFSFQKYCLKFLHMGCRVYLCFLFFHIGVQWGFFQSLQNKNWFAEQEKLWCSHTMVYAAVPLAPFFFSRW